MSFLDWNIMIINSASSTYQSRKNEWPGFLGMGIMCIWQIRLIGKHYAILHHEETSTFISSFLS